MEISSVDNVDNAFKRAIRVGTAAIAVQLHPLFAANQVQIVDRAANDQIPAAYPRVDFVMTGGLMSYGADRDEPYRRAAVLVDKILKGAKPADLPVEQPTKFELVINLKTADRPDNSPQRAGKGG